MQLIWSPGMSMDDVEKSVIMLALRFHQGNKTQTAQSLGIAYRTLDDKLKKYKEHEEEIKKIAEERRIKRHESLRAERGLPVQQDARSSEEQSVSVQERQKIQEMPSKSSPTIHPNKRNTGKVAQREG